MSVRRSHEGLGTVDVSDDLTDLTSLDSDVDEARGIQRELIGAPGITDELGD